MTTINTATWHRKLQGPDSSEVNGYSPGGAAEELGISRQAIMQAISHGRLDAVRVPLPRGPGCFWIITPAALQAFSEARNKRGT